MTQSRPPRSLTPEQLRWTCDPDGLPRVSPKDRPAMEIIGQDRALDALRMGLAIRQPGYHIFVTGTEGTGRTTTIRRVLEDYEGRGETPEDLCYVFNFEGPDLPILLRFPAGKGREFQRRIDTLVGSLRRHIPKIYRDETYQKRVSRLQRHYRNQQSGAVKAFAEKAQKSGFALVQIQSGPYLRPELRAVVDDEEWDVGDLGQLVDEGRLASKVCDRIEKRYLILRDELQALVRANRQLEEEYEERMLRLEEETVHPLIHDTVDMLREAYEDERIREWLGQLEKAFVDEVWVRGEDEDDDDEEPEEPFCRYAVNVIIDNSRQKGAPVIIESTPTFQNLFGTIERRPLPGGGASFDHRQIRAGSLARAQGGTLVIMAQDLLEEGLVWPTLKRVLRNRKLQIQGYDPANRMVITPLKPDPVDLDVKVILVGSTVLYNTLLQDDPDLQRVFHVKVDFETDMPRNRDNMRRYLSFLRKVQRQDGLLPVSDAAAAAVLEYGVRLARRKDRLSTRFSDIVAVLIEADYFAKAAGAKSIGVSHVDRALAERARRLGQAEQHTLKAVREGTLLIRTRGESVGQVNALFVLEQWDYAYGLPVKLTASTSLGEGDILSLEREADLSGSSFDKGHFILAGFLRGRFAQDKPLHLHASISCEQNYIGVDGDSASLAELCVLLSALAGAPIRQSLAVTGSVNQFGDVQPVGGANAKVEGFWKVCRDRGLTGAEGVILPASNVKNLQLDKDLVADARRGDFHVHAVKTVDQALELLTGLPAGRRRKDGSWTPGSLGARVDSRLREMAVIFKRYADGPVRRGARA